VSNLNTLRCQTFLFSLTVPELRFLLSCRLFSETKNSLLKSLNFFFTNVVFRFSTLKLAYYFEIPYYFVCSFFEHSVKKPLNTLQDCFFNKVFHRQCTIIVDIIACPDIHRTPHN